MTAPMDPEVAGTPEEFDEWLSQQHGPVSYIDASDCVIARYYRSRGHERAKVTPGRVLSPASEPQRMPDWLLDRELHFKVVGIVDMQDAWNAWRTRVPLASDAERSFS